MTDALAAEVQDDGSLAAHPLVPSRIVRRVPLAQQIDQMRQIPAGVRSGRVRAAEIPVHDLAQCRRADAVTENAAEQVLVSVDRRAWNLESRERCNHKPLRMIESRGRAVAAQMAGRIVVSLSHFTHDRQAMALALSI